MNAPTTISEIGRPESVRRADLAREQDGFQRNVLADPTTKANELTANLVIAERAEFLLDTDDSEAVAEVANTIDENPHLFAMRFLKLEREVEELRRRLDAQRGAR